MARSRPSGVPSCLLFVLALAACTSAQPPKPPPTPRVIVLGIDGFSPNVLIGLLARERLPTFARLSKEGALGRVDTSDTGLPSFSPRIWTSFATGVLPEQHGIIGFVRIGGPNRTLYASTDRLVPAIWEIASASGRRVGVVNWPITFPAEPVNGFVISERYLPSTAAKVDLQYGKIPPEGLVHPPELAKTLVALGIHATSKVPFVPEVAAQDDRDVLTLTWAALAEHPVDVLLVYTHAMDALQHLTWNTHEVRPGEPKPPVDKVEGLVELWDEMLGEFMTHLTPLDHLIVLSDHGGERNPDPKGLPGAHGSRAAAFGVLLITGPRVKPGATSGTTLDIAPTILELAGVPPSTSMPGKVLPCVMPAGTELLPRREQPYERTTRDHPAPADAGAVDDTIRDRLRDLGYIQ